MHPALNIENLSSLPARYRLMAMSAANGSPRDLRRVCSYLNVLDGRLLLPILYRSLDPANIPNAVDLEGPSSELSQKCANCAAMALDCIVWILPDRMTFQSDVAAEFWPRVWAWIQFLHEYRDSLPVVLADPTTTYGNYGSIIRYFALDLLDTTPGLKAVIAAVWTRLIGVRGDSHESTYTKESTYSLLCQILRPLTASEETQPHLAELVEGSGGTVGDLLSVLMLHLRSAIWTPESRVTPDTLNDMLFEGTSLIYGIINSNAYGAMDSALVSRGIIEVIISALRSLLRSGISSASADATLCFVLKPLIHFLSAAPSSEYTNVPRALKAGLLRFIIEASQQSESVCMILKRLLEQILSPVTVWHFVLVQLQKDLADVAELETSLAFRGSCIFPEWTRFRELATARIHLMQEYDAGMHKSLKGCSNIDCGLIKQKIQSLRCSACSVAYHCDRDCQIADWTAGHQQTCRDLALYHRQLIGTRSKRNTSFLRVLVDSDYQRSRDTILVQHMFEGRRNPLSFSSVRFDYTSGVLRLTALQIPLPPAATTETREYERLVNGGRMQLHQIVLTVASVDTNLIIPMRMESPAVRNELRRIANTLPEGAPADLSSLAPETRAEITALLEIEVKETHCT
ncbi:hypothetical protein C8R46DRAFT_1353815 [Mycena filopes]|nr:hypothetical protein C8R46DRAFT_1353815 [Mycena filopes]